jgi:hypothetical protein
MIVQNLAVASFLRNCNLVYKFPLELQPGCKCWEAFQRLRLVSKGVKAIVEALPEFRHMNKMHQLRQALHERHQVGKRMMAGGPRCMRIDVAL